MTGRKSHTRSCFLFILIILHSVCAAQEQVQVNWSPVREIVHSDSILPVVEPHISAHPTDSNTLLVAAMLIREIDRPYESGQLLSFHSADKGRTWNESKHDFYGYDPWTAIHADSRAELAWSGTANSFQHQFPVQILRSTDAGSTWTGPTQQIDGAHDGTKIVTTSSSSFFSTVKFNEQMGADVLLYSSVKGSGYKEIVRIPGKNTRLSFCQPALLSDSIVIIPVSNFLRRLWVYRYDTRSQELSEKIVVTARPGGAKGYMQLVSDRHEGSPYQNRLYFVRGLGSGSNFEGIWLNTSCDGGLTWSKDRRLDRFPANHKSAATLPCTAVNSKGIVAMAWFDRSKQNPHGRHTYFCYSLDGGETFSLPQIVSNSESEPDSKANGEVANKFPGGGHYMGMVDLPDDSFQLIWSAAVDGKAFRLFTRNVRIKV